MEFKRENPNCSFTVPDRITVRMQMTYFSQASIRPSADLWERLWSAALPLIENWQCELAPDKNINLDEVTDVNVTNVIIWASSQVQRYMDGLGTVSKN